MCSKQAGNCFLVSSATFLIQNMCVQTGERLLCSLFGYFCNTNMFLRFKREVAFLVYSVTFVIRNMCVQNKEGCFCNTKNICSKQGGGWFLVY